MLTPDEKGGRVTAKLTTHQNAVSRRPMLFITSFSFLFSLETFCDKKYINGDKETSTAKKNTQLSMLSVGERSGDLIWTPLIDFISSQTE